MRVCVDYNGFEFEVVGEWTPRYGATLTEPGGGGFEAFDILLDGKSIAELLDAKADDKICELAAEKAQDMMMGY